MVTLRSWSPLFALFVIASLPRVPGHMEVTVQAIGASPSLNEYESGSAQFQVTNWTGLTVGSRSTAATAGRWWTVRIRRTCTSKTANPRRSGWSSKPARQGAAA